MANGTDDDRVPTPLASDEAKELKHSLDSLRTLSVEQYQATMIRLASIDGRLDAFVRGVRLELEDMKVSKMPSVPPMRPPLESSHQIIEQGKREAELLVKEEARRSAGPVDLVDPEAATRIATDVFAKLMSDREADIKARADADRLAALEEAESKRLRALQDAATQRQKDVRKIRVTLYGAIATWVVLGVLGAMAGLVWVGAKTVAARELGHAEGVREVRSLVAPAGSGR